MRVFLQVLFVALLLPLVSSQDLGSCVTDIISVVGGPWASSVATVIAFVECVADGTLGQCQLGCALSSCLTYDDVECEDCNSQCDDPTFLNSSCFTTVEDLISTIPVVGLFATLYEAFSDCIGFGWAAETIPGYISDPDIFQQFCDLLDSNNFPLPAGC
jgi:hypothetical protein